MNKCHTYPRKTDLVVVVSLHNKFQEVLTYTQPNEEFNSQGKFKGEDTW